MVHQVNGKGLVLQQRKVWEMLQRNKMQIKEATQTHKMTTYEWKMNFD